MIGREAITGGSATGGPAPSHVAASESLLRGFRAKIWVIQEPPRLRGQGQNAPGEGTAVQRPAGGNGSINPHAAEEETEAHEEKPRDRASTGAGGSGFEPGIAGVRAPPEGRRATADSGNTAGGIAPPTPRLPQAPPRGMTGSARGPQDGARNPEVSATAVKLGETEAPRAPRPTGPGSEVVMPPPRSKKPR